MSATPETDAAVHASGGNWSPVLRAVSQRLERERDEARDMVENLTDRGLNLMDSNRMLKRERDEAREQRDSLAEIAKQFVSILDITEQSDGGRLFHPTNITSCRAGDLQKIGELVEALRRASKTDRIIRNAEIAELEGAK